MFYLPVCQLVYGYKMYGHIILGCLFVPFPWALQMLEEMLNPGVQGQSLKQEATEAPVNNHINLYRITKCRSAFGSYMDCSKTLLQISLVQIKPKMLEHTCQLCRKFQIFHSRLSPPLYLSLSSPLTPYPRITLPQSEGDMAINPIPKSRDGFCPAVLLYDYIFKPQGVAIETGLLQTERRYGPCYLVSEGAAGGLTHISVLTDCTWNLEHEGFLMASMQCRLDVPGEQMSASGHWVSYPYGGITVRQALHCFSEILQQD